MTKFSLHNIIPILYEEIFREISNESVDIVYALDMFHQVNSPIEFLEQIHRIIKRNGCLILEDDH